VSAKLNEMLNKSIARELQVAIQYMWQHVEWSGVQGHAVMDALKNTAVAEMKHAEAIAERLSYLGEKPTTKPEPIFVMDNLKAMLEQDRKDEEGAIALYKEVIKTAQSEGDVTTAYLFMDILKAEEEHHDLFTTLLEGVM
jgi:bacterioferritin